MGWFIQNLAKFNGLCERNRGHMDIYLSMSDLVLGLYDTCDSDRPVMPFTSWPTSLHGHGFLEYTTSQVCYFCDIRAQALVSYSQPPISNYVLEGVWKGGGGYLGSGYERLWYEMPQMKTKHLYTFCVYWKPNYHSSIETSLLFIHAPIEEEEHT